MDTEQLVLSVRRRVVAELASLVEIDYPSLAWSKGLEALVQLATAASSDRRARLCLAGFAHREAPRTTAAALIDFAAGLELHHLFVLVVDDIMDQGSLRRGQPTLHCALRTVVGRSDAERLAGLLAAIIQTRAIRLMTTSDPSGRAAGRVVSASQAAGIAQFRDLVGLGREGFTAETFLRFLFDKGGDHSVAAPLVAGALLADPETHALASLERWAFHAGVAFQALDDLADYLASPLETGKDAFQDLVNRRPSILTYLLGEAIGAAATQQVLSGPLTPGHRRHIAGLLEQHGILARACAFVAHHVAQAERVEGLPDKSRAGLEAVLGALRAELDAARAHPDLGPSAGAAAWS